MERSVTPVKTNMIYILEGADGTGKSTLAAAIAKQTNAVVLHQTYNKTWNMKVYLQEIMSEAQTLAHHGINIVLDRWAPSEIIYGNAFRKGPSFDVEKMIDKYVRDPNIVWIYCYNDKAVENHMDNANKREEMFPDISDVVLRYEEYIEESGLPWVKYSYDVFGTDKFVKEVTNERPN